MSGGRLLKIKARFDLDLSALEFRPYVMVYTSVEGPPKRWYKLLRIKKRNEELVIDDIPVPGKGVIWPSDGTIYFMLFTAMTGLSSGEKKFGYETAALGKLLLVDVAAYTQTDDVTDHNREREFKVPMIMNMVRGEPWFRGKKLPRKGNIIVKASIPDDVKFAEPGPFDVTPGNVENLMKLVDERARMELCNIMVAGDGGGNADYKIRPFMPEIANVFAPVYVTPSGLTMPEEHFLTRTTMHTPDADECEDFMEMILASLITEFSVQLGSPKRLNGQTDDGNNSSKGMRKDTIRQDLMTKEYLFNVAKEQLENNGTSYYDPRMNDFIRFMGRFISRFSNACVYHADIVDLNKSRSKDKYNPALKKVIENFWDPAFSGCGDCEDFTKDMARTFTIMCKNRKEFKNPMLRLMGKVCNDMYIACGALCSVTSASIQEQEAGSGDPTRQPDIGSVEDKKATTGAHMFLILIPREYMIKCIDHTISNDGEKLRNKLKMPSNKYGNWVHSLPVSICEGTGHLMPLIMSNGFYHTDPIEKHFASHEQKMMNSAIDKLSHIVDKVGMDSLQMARRQENIRDDPMKSPSRFFRSIVELCTVGLQEEIEGLDDCTYSLHPPSLETINQKKRVSMYSFRKMRPAYLENAMTRGGNKRFKRQGVHLLHILQKKDLIGMMLNPRATAIHEAAFLSIMRHLPPEPYYGGRATMMDRQGSDALNTSFYEFSRMIEKNRTEWDHKPTLTSKTRWISLFDPLIDVFLPYDESRKSSKLTLQARELANALRQHPDVISIKPCMDVFNPAVMEAQILVLVRI